MMRSAIWKYTWPRGEFCFSLGGGWMAVVMILRDEKIPLPLLRPDRAAGGVCRSIADLAAPGFPGGIFQPLRMVLFQNFQRGFQPARFGGDNAAGARDYTVFRLVAGLAGVAVFQQDGHGENIFLTDEAAVQRIGNGCFGW